MFDKAYLTMLEFPEILGQLAGYTRTQAARSRALELIPMQNMDAIERAQALTRSGRRVYEAMGEPPVYSLTGLDALNEKLRLGEVLTAAELLGAAEFLHHCRLLKAYLQRALTIHELLPSQGMSIEPLDDLRKEIERCFAGEELSDRASARLYAIRTRMTQTVARIKERLGSLMRAHPEWFQEQFYSTRNRRYVLPVKREFTRQIRGSALDTSSSGATIFIEPEAVSALQEELMRLEMEESAEVLRILAELSALVADSRAQFAVNRESMERLDYYFACGRMASEMKCGEVVITRNMELSLECARHPLLGDAAVPMDLRLYGRRRALIITGPNTGGKTVSLKTAGLLSLMALSGLLIPAQSARIPLFAGVYCDIGDGQSLNQNLSTFSSHMKRVVHILQSAGPRSLVLLDELGSGTDPQEGMGLAIAVLSDLSALKCLLMATSHYPELKRFAAEAEGFTNARMTFDKSTLSPTYHLELGEAGQSCAIDIARRLGMPPRILDKAKALAYPSGAPEDALISALPPAGEEDADDTRFDTPDAPDVQEKAPSATGDAREKAPNAAGDEPEKAEKAPEKYAVGDRVRVPFMNTFATVVLPPNAKGEILVRVRDKNISINEKRVKPFLTGDKLYPGADYDLDIVLDTWENRKNRKQVSKGKTHVSAEVRPQDR